MSAQKKAVSAAWHHAMQNRAHVDQRRGQGCSTPRIGEFAYEVLRGRGCTPCGGIGSPWRRRPHFAAQLPDLNQGHFLQRAGQSQRRPRDCTDAEALRCAVAREGDHRARRTSDKRALRRDPRSRIAPISRLPQGLDKGAGSAPQRNSRTYCKPSGVNLLRRRRPPAADALEAVMRQLQDFRNPGNSWKPAAALAWPTPEFYQGVFLHGPRRWRGGRSIRHDGDDGSPAP